MRDATEHKFAVAGRRVIVRAGRSIDPAPDLVAAARVYGLHCKQFLDAANVTVSDGRRTAQVDDAIVVAAELPDGRLWAAILHFAGGPLVELSLTAERGDLGAADEFERLLESARPSAATPTQAVARGLAAGRSGAAGYPAGPLLLDLPADATSHARFVLESADGQARYHFAAATGLETSATKFGVLAPLLASGVAVGVAEDGRAVRYEPGQLRRFDKSAPRAGVAAMEGFVKGAGAPDAPASPAVTGTFRGVPLLVRYDGPGATAEAAEELLRVLNATG